MEHNNFPKVERVVSYLPQFTILLLTRREYKIIELLICTEFDGREPWV